MPAVTKDEVSTFEKALSAAGDIDPIAENLIDAASAISGAVPPSYTSSSKHLRTVA